MKVSEIIKQLRVEDLDKEVIVTENEIIFRDTDRKSASCENGFCEIEWSK